jgi:hypothetical protein
VYFAERGSYPCWFSSGWSGRSSTPRRSYCCRWEPRDREPADDGGNNPSFRRAVCEKRKYCSVGGAWGDSGASPIKPYFHARRCAPAHERLSHDSVPAIAASKQQPILPEGSRSVWRRQVWRRRRPRDGSRQGSRTYCVRPWRQLSALHP